MKLVRLTDPDTDEFKTFYGAYSTAFQKGNFRNEEQIKKMIKEKEDFEVFLAYEDTTFVGFVSGWVLKEPEGYHLMEHNGVVKEMRGKGKGKLLVKTYLELKKKVAGHVPSVENLSFYQLIVKKALQGALAFLLKCGLQQNDKLVEDEKTKSEFKKVVLLTYPEKVDEKVHGILGKALQDYMIDIGE